MKKRILTILLSICMILNFAAGCSSDNNKAVEHNENTVPIETPEIEAEYLSYDMEFMTRAEWIALLAQTIGMEEYNCETPYFSDVTSDLLFYNYVQSSYEWGVLDFEENLFHPDDVASREFVAVTAVLASGVKSSDNSSVSELCVFAELNGVISFADDDNSSGVMFAEGKVAAEVAKSLYLNNHDAEINEVTMAEGVKDFRYVPEESVQINGSSIVMPASMAEDLSVGDIYLAPGTVYNPYGIAMKITAMSPDGDMVYIDTVTPELDEVFTDINVSARVAPRAEQILVSDGVELENYSTSNMFTSMITSDDANYGTTNYYSLLAEEETEMINQPKGATFSFAVNKKSGEVSKMSFSSEWNDNKITVERILPVLPLPEGYSGNMLDGVDVVDDKSINTIFEKTNYIVLKDKNGNAKVDKNGWEKRLDVEEKFKKGYEITGKLELKNFYVEPTFEFHKLWGIPIGIDRVAIEVNYDVISSLKLKGKLENELTIATMPIPVAGPITVELSLIIFANASGELELKWELANNTKMEYSHGKVKKTQDSQQSKSFDLAVEIDAGAALDVMLSAAGIKLIDAKVSAAVNAKTEGYVKCSVTEDTNTQNLPSNRERLTYNYLIGIKCVICLPIIKLSIGTKPSLANKLNLKWEWTLVSKENAPLKWKPEKFNTEISLLTITVEADKEDAELDDESEEGVDEKTEKDEFDIYDSIKIDKLIITLNVMEKGQIQITSLPEEISIDQVSFFSKNTMVATVDNNGLVTAKGPGTTQIWVQTPDGGLQICLISVIEDYSIKNGSFL